MHSSTRSPTSGVKRTIERIWSITPLWIRTVWYHHTRQAQKRGEKRRSPLPRLLFVVCRDACERFAVGASALGSEGCGLAVLGDDKPAGALVRSALFGADV